MRSSSAPVLILGAGINGAALARELVLNNIPVVVVDTADIASGTTAYSTRLIHGGLRYLEYGSLGLVRESLQERTRWLRLAPHFVEPLKLLIPVEHRWGNVSASIARLLHRERPATKHAPRGVIPIKTGLALYDKFAGDRDLPGHRTEAINSPSAPRLDSRFRWLVSYYDAQIRYPERFTLALLQDAQSHAQSLGLQCDVYTYHQAVLEGSWVSIESVIGGPGASTKPRSAARFQPAAIVNATGAWVDQTLAQLGIPAKRMLGGTKGSHFITSNRQLRESLAGAGVYAEARDGRPIFVLPFGDTTLIGTTDERFEAAPELAVASAEELDYLIRSVNDLFPEVQLGLSDVDLHYSGVRPLPYAPQGSTASITRGHWMQEHSGTPMPMYSIIGGKLTTCRSLAEQSADTLLKRLGRTRASDSRSRPLPGARPWPSGDDRLASAEVIADQQDRWARELNVDARQMRAMWALCGTVAREVVGTRTQRPLPNLPGTDLPVAMAQWSIDREQVRTLDDLIERRLMLLYDSNLSRDCLLMLAGMLTEGGITAQSPEEQARRSEQRLLNHFGKRVKS